MWLSVLDAAFRFGIFIYEFFGAKKENYKWMVEALKVVRQRKMERARYIIESEQRQIDELNKRWEEIERSESK